MTGEIFAVSYERVLDVHKRAIRQFGGDYSDPKNGCIEQCLGGAKTSTLYHAPDGDLLIFASYLLQKFALNHCFTDGNKRVAWMVFIDILATQSFAIDATQKEAENLVLDIIEKKLSIEHITTWAENRLVNAHQQ